MSKQSNSSKKAKSTQKNYDGMVTSSSFKTVPGVGTLDMPRFYDLLPKGDERKEMEKYLDLEEILLRVKYNPHYNQNAENMKDNLDVKYIAFTAPQGQDKLKIVWRKENGNDEICGFRIIALLIMARFSLIQHDSCEQLAAPAFVYTDTHGQLSDLLRWLYKFAGPEQQQKYNYVICGDMVDRGPCQLEVLLLMLYYKVRYPTRFFVLRGNHEDFLLHKQYGFYDVLKQQVLESLKESAGKYTTLAENMYYMIIHVFDYLPVALVLEKKIFCVHGGLSPILSMCEGCKNDHDTALSITDICELSQHATMGKDADALVKLVSERVRNPCELGTNGTNAQNYRAVVTNSTFHTYEYLLYDLLWSDPAPIGKGGAGSNDERWLDKKGYQFNTARNTSVFFGANVIEKFLNTWKLSLVIRGHLVKRHGYEWHYKKRLLTVFSAPSYHEGNKAGMATVTVLDGSQDTRKLRVEVQVLEVFERNKPV